MPKYSKSHNQLIQHALADPEIKQAYDELEEEFALLRTLLVAREKAGKTQADVAKAMQTTTSVVGRLETGGGGKRHSPTIGTLQRYARAVGCRLELRLIPVKSSAQKRGKKTG